MTLTLSKLSINWLLKMQKKLDLEIKKKKDITNKEWKEEFAAKHSLAINIEVSEFINECHDLWKYWKDKPVNKERILDEAIDVLHFIMLHWIKQNGTGDALYNAHRVYARGFADLPVDDVALEQLQNHDDIAMKLMILLKVLDHYGFTEQDIIEQYKIKNKENFRRLESGY
ncbi:dUTP diphosphatase [Salinicoccus roseus]|uniref:dUTP diphosphatase n=1 Tax=Salinicoccus roseus TaxID=45670 RepID=UPI002300ECB3|nr:dUTP diphosphatase [Salinicoccus roseus]